MALTTILQLFVRLFLVITVISLNNDTVRNGIMVSAKFLVKPLWDVYINRSDPCILGNMSDDELLFTGSPSYTCSLLVDASEGTHLQLQIHGLTNDYETHSYFYLERINEEPGSCSDKYTVFNNLFESCVADITAGDMQIVLYGAANLTISGKSISADASPPCSESIQDTMSEKANRFSCKGIQKYRDIVVCGKMRRMQWWEEFIYNCPINFKPSACNIILGLREAVYDCSMSTAMRSSNKVFIPYPNGVYQNDVNEMEELILWKNKISELNPRCFIGLSKLTDLRLDENLLSVLHENVFSDLLSLKKLTLDSNQISDLNAGCFRGLTNLTDLWLGNNSLTILQENGFVDLVSLEYLDLDSNQISDLNAGCFEGLSKLTHLILEENLLSVWHGNEIADLVRLKLLDLGQNQLSDINAGYFQGLGNLTYLMFKGNSLSVIHENVFADLVSLELLYLMNNKISNLSVGCFQGLSKLTDLLLDGNLLSALHENVFADLVRLERLHLNDNQISDLNARYFDWLSNLRVLQLDDNLLSALHENVFPVSLEALYMYSNQISDLNVGCFKGLSELWILFLDNNSLGHISHETVFADLTGLEFLYMTRNQISRLDSGCFQGLINVKTLELSHNLLRTLYKDVFTDLISLEQLYLHNNPLTSFSKAAFSFLPSNLTLRVSQHEICECYSPTRNIVCNAGGIKDSYFTCDRLLSDKTLGVFTWLIGFIALGGNLFVLIWKNKENAKNKVNSTLLINLAISDSLMGIYMLILGSADVYFGESFPMNSANWRSGVTCRIAGALAIISSEASVLFIMLISIDRVICIRDPFSKWKLTQRSVRILLGLKWGFSAVLGIVPSVLAGKFTQFYDNSHVCIGIPLALERYSISHINYTQNYCDDFWYNVLDGDKQCDPTIVVDVGSFYSTTLFIVLNSFCFLVVLACYVGIVSAVRKSAQRSKRSMNMVEQIRLTAKVSSIIATDFCCWFPIILLGILVQTRVITLSANAFAWCVTLVLPINSALNPFVYTIPDAISQYRKERKWRHKEQQRLDENDV